MSWREVNILDAVTADGTALSDARPVWCEGLDRRGFYRGWWAGLPVRQRQIPVCPGSRVTRVEILCEMMDGNRVWWPPTQLHMLRRMPWDVSRLGRVSLPKVLERLDMVHLRWSNPRRWREERRAA